MKSSFIKEIIEKINGINKWAIYQILCIYISYNIQYLMSIRMIKHCLEFMYVKNNFMKIIFNFYHKLIKSKTFIYIRLN